jgi:hypothetical protein
VPGGAREGRRVGVLAIGVTIEPRRTRTPIDRVDVSAIATPSVLARVVQDVHERVLNLARRSQHMDVIPVCEDSPLTPNETMDDARQSHEQPLHATSEGVLVIGFHDDVHVIVHHRVLHHRDFLRAATRSPRR